MYILWTGRDINKTERWGNEAERKVRSARGERETVYMSADRIIIKNRVMGIFV